jgi:HK97 family phage portal protein
MHIFGLTITRRTKAAVPPMGLTSAWDARVGSAGWAGLIRESFPGAWQRNITASTQDVMSHSTAWSCVTLIASDIGKLRILLQEEDTNGITEEVSNPAYSPVLRKPNHYQNRIKFLETWIVSKLTRGNTYVLKERDKRGVVSSLYVLDPARVKVLVASGGRCVLRARARSAEWTDGIRGRAGERDHPRLNGAAVSPALWGVADLRGVSRAVLQGLTIQDNSERLFENGSQPGGILTSPFEIGPQKAKEMQDAWDAQFGGSQNVGKVAVLGGGLKFEQMAVTAVDAQLIDQLKWGDERICSVFHVPPYMVGVGPAPTYNNIEALNQQYYAQCLQALIESVELCLNEGLELNDPFGVELDLDGLLRMDSATKMKVATDGVKGGIYTPNEGRKMHNKPPMEGGDTVYLQQQDYSIEALNRRDQSAPAPSTTLDATAVGAKDLLEIFVRELHAPHGIAPVLAVSDPDQTDDVLDAFEKAMAA